MLAIKSTATASRQKMAAIHAEQWKHAQYDYLATEINYYEALANHFTNT